MTYATGTRILAALFGLTGVGIPIALVLLYHARKKEQERKEELEAIKQQAGN